jgi:hypothetical protein
MQKDELLDTIRVAHRQLERYIFRFEKDRQGAFVASDRPKVGHDEMLQPGVVGNWSLKDLLGHVIDWEQRLLRWMQAGPAGQVPSGVPEPDVPWVEMDPAEAELPPGLRAQTLEAVLARFQSSFREVMAALEAVPAPDLFEPGRFAWTGDYTVADFVVLATRRHYDWAKHQIRRWRKTHAGTTLNKQEILNRIRTERRRLEQNLERLSDEQMLAPGVVGDWSVKDLLAHLADWEQRFLGWYEAGLRGEVPETPAPGLRWSELDVLNQQIYERHRDRSLSDVRNEFHASYQQITETVRQMPEEAMFEPRRYEWLGESNLVTYILANTANHYRWAKGQLRAWLRSQGAL